MKLIDRRTVVAGGAALLGMGVAGAAQAQAKPKLRLSIAFPEGDLRAEGYKAFAAAMKDEFDLEPFWSNTLFKQGTELVALQRDNLELCNLAPADISKQIPAWSLLTSAYLFRDYDHLKKTFASEVGQDFIKMAREQVGIEVIRPVYFGARQVNLKPTKKINTPADMAGIKLRMPPGEFWQFLGELIGANPTPVAFAELYTALQAGAVDGQDNPLVGPHDEVLRGNLAIRPHQPRHRLRRVGVEESLGGTRRRKAGQVPCRGRQGVRRECREIRRAGEGRHRVLQEGKASRFTRPTRTPSAPSPRRSKPPTNMPNDWPKGALEEDQRDQVTARSQANYSIAGRRLCGDRWLISQCR